MNGQLLWQSSAVQGKGMEDAGIILKSDDILLMEDTYQHSRLHHDSHQGLGLTP